MSKRWWIALAAAVLAGNAAAGSSCIAYASDEIRIIGESEEETAAQDAAEEAGAAESTEASAQEEESEAPAVDAPAAEQTAAEETEQEQGSLTGEAQVSLRDEAEEAARSLYGRMQKSADLNDNETFASLFAEEMDPNMLQSQLQAVKSSLNLTASLDRHSDYCFFLPSGEDPSEPCAVSLTDYATAGDGSVNWYSTLLCVEKVSGEWKVSSRNARDYLQSLYPVEYTEAEAAGSNAADLYPYFAMRFEEDAVFDGAFYSLPCMFWQNSDGSVTFGLWLSNGQGGTKWCDSIELNLTDSQLGTVADVRIPVQTASAGQSSSFLQYSIPAESVRTGNLEWTSLTVRSNLIYE